MPIPYASAFMNWDRPPHYGAYFFWKVGVKPEHWYEAYHELGKKVDFFWWVLPIRRDQVGLKRLWKHAINSFYGLFQI